MKVTKWDYLGIAFLFSLTIAAVAVVDYKNTPPKKTELTGQQPIEPLVHQKEK